MYALSLFMLAKIEGDFAVDWPVARGKHRVKMGKHEPLPRGKPTGSGEFQESLGEKQNKPLPPRTESPKAESLNISDTAGSRES